MIRYALAFVAVMLLALAAWLLVGMVIDDAAAGVALIGCLVLLVGPVPGLENGAR